MRNVRKEEAYKWFFEVIEKSLEKYKWNTKEDGSFSVRRIEDNSEIHIGLIFQEYDAEPDFGVPGMATARALGPTKIHNEFTNILRKCMFDIINDKN